VTRSFFFLGKAVLVISWSFTIIPIAITHRKAADRS